MSSLHLNQFKINVNDCCSWLRRAHNVSDLAAQNDKRCQCCSSSAKERCKKVQRVKSAQREHSRTCRMDGINTAEPRMGHCRSAECCLKFGHNSHQNSNIILHIKPSEKVLDFIRKHGRVHTVKSKRTTLRYGDV